MFFQTLIHWWWLDAAFRGNSATLCSPFDRDIAWDWLVLLKHLFYSIGYSLVWKETVVYWSFFSSLYLHLFVSVVSLPSDQNRSNWIWPTNPTHGGLRRSRLQCRNNRSPLNATGMALNGRDFRGLLLSLSLTHAKRGGGRPWTGFASHRPSALLLADYRADLSGRGGAGSMVPLHV